MFAGILCSGLQHMHNLETPYAHNDVKPGNVLLTHRKGQPPLAVLMDFGSARPARKQIRSRSEALQLQTQAVIKRAVGDDRCAFDVV
ncbi:serine/threonine-protein kinase 16-like protein [Tanacetum coccineum]